jgi:probable phosphoglycerate mutase
MKVAITHRYYFVFLAVSRNDVLPASFLFWNSVMNQSQTTIIFVRHLAADPGTGNGVNDSTHVGGNAREQLGDLLRSLRGYAVTRVCSSDVTRAAETAEIIAEEFGVPLELRPTLREIFHVRSTPPESSEFGSTGAVTAPVPAIEADDKASIEVRERNVSDAVDEIVAQNEGSCAVIVTHSGTIRAGIRHLLGLPLQTHDINPLAYGGFVVLSRDASGSWRAATT